jgi:phosphoribosylformimino-5-aminoimidazole carboxamide ribotide isomerase
VVDLDAATGNGNNDDVVALLLASSGMPAQVGGGVRTAERVAGLLAAGARRVIVGTRAITDRDWLADIVALHPGSVMLAADVRNGKVAVKGWSETVDLEVAELLQEVSSLQLAGILVTAVDAEGRMEGPDIQLVERALGATTLPVHASGGIGNIGHLRSLAACGATAAVIGMALYTGALDAERTAEEFSS